MNVTYYNLKEALKERADVNKRIDLLCKMLAEEMHPYSVGDIIEVRGYSHEGKQCMVTNASITIDHKDKIDFFTRAKVLKKDGSESQHFVKWQSWNDDNLKRVLDILNSEQTVTDVK